LHGSQHELVSDLYIPGQGYLLTIGAESRSIVGWSNRYKIAQVVACGLGTTGYTVDWCR
jgi:hypothetical protein